VKLAVVVQRYGADINGGAELHARYIAEHLSRHADVEVLTTCARDYVTWRNELPPGVERVGRVPIRRFPVDRERLPADFARRSEHVFGRRHSLASELAWLNSEGPTSPALLAHIRSSRESFDYFIFFSYRYHHAYHGVRAVGSRAVLVPTAERDPAVGLALFGPVFRGVRALMYNSHEERAMLQHVSGNADVPGVVVGVGSEIPVDPRPERFRQAFGIQGRYVVYVGRIDENKGCRELFDHFSRYSAADRRGLTLVLVGRAIMPVPAHPRIRHLGYLPDEEKFDAIAGADALVMPSVYESLSMVAIEAWGLGRPVLANGRCDVLKGQCLRSNAGLYYDSLEEFLEALDLLVSDRKVQTALGHNGRAYFTEHYAWDVVERRYLEMFEGLDREGVAAARMEPLPGWLGRFRRNLPPAADVVAAIPAGPVGLPQTREHQSQVRGAVRAHP
jgi:glycosyltransferase involved in cell wall biosynthesis